MKRKKLMILLMVLRRAIKIEMIVSTERTVSALYGIEKSGNVITT